LGNQGHASTCASGGSCGFYASMAATYDNDSVIRVIHLLMMGGQSAASPLF
jgi:hypothetical protein